MSSDSHHIVEFLKLIGTLKNLERFRGQYYWRDYPQRDRYDSVADHTWRMAMMLILVEKKLSQPIDVSKALKMVLIHDIAEIITGDLSPLGSDGTGKDSHTYNKDAAQKKYENENEAAKKIFLKLPRDLGDELYALWLEYEKQEVFEAKVVKAVDKLEGKLQAAEYTKGTMVKPHLDFSIKFGAEAINIDPILKELGVRLVEELTKKAPGV